MIDALVSGKIFGQPKQRTGTNGQPFVVCKVRAATGAGESIFVSVICFNGDTCKALLALGDGDSVALAGTLTPRTWTDRDGVTKPSLDLMAQQALTPYHVTRKRRAVNEDDTDQ